MTLRKHLSAFTSGHPLHRSVRALLMHTAPTSGNNAHALERIRMMDFNMRKPSLDNRVHAFPAYAPSVSTPTKGSPPMSCDLVAKRAKGIAVVGDTIVTIMPVDHRPEPLTLFGNGKVHAPSGLDSYVEKLGSQSLWYRSPSDRIHLVLPFLGTDVREAKEVKCLRFTRSTLIPVVDGPWTKLQNSRLLRMKLKAEREQTLFQISQKLLGLRPMFKTHNEVVGPSHDDHLTARFVRSTLLRPEIQGVMKVDICKQGTDRPSLRNTLFRLRPLAILHDTRREPFLNQADHAFIPNSVFDKLDQPVMVEVVEEAPDISIQDPVHSSRQETDIESIEAVVLPLAGSISIGKTEKVSLVDRVQHFDRGPLDDLVFQSGNAQRALLAIGLGDKHSAYWLGPVTSALQASGKIIEVCLKIFSVAFPRLAVDTSSGGFLHGEVGRSKPVDARDVVHEVRRPHLLIALSDFAYTVERTWHRYLRGFLSPRGVLLDLFPSVRRPPSIPLRRRLSAAVVRELRRYFASIRLPVIVHHRRVSLDFTMRASSIAPPTDHGISRFSRRLLRNTHKVSDPARHQRLSPKRTADCGPIHLAHPLTAWAPGLNISGLDTRPVLTPVNAWSRPLRDDPHDLGTAWLAKPSLIDFCIQHQSAGLSRRTKGIR
jgi:hypothetical protein